MYRKKFLMLIASFSIFMISIFSYPTYIEAQQGANYEILLSETPNGCIGAMCLYNPGNECNSPGSKFKLCASDE